MTINIDPLEPAVASPLRAAAPAVAPTSASFAVALAKARVARAAQDGAPEAPALALVASPPDEPPAEVQAQTAAAARTWETLAASGREVRFSENPGGRVGVSLHHQNGERIAVLQLNDLYTLIEQEGAG